MNRKSFFRNLAALVVGAPAIAKNIKATPELTDRPTHEVKEIVIDGNNWVTYKLTSEKMIRFRRDIDAQLWFGTTK